MMKLEEQSAKLTVMNFDQIVQSKNTDPKKKRHGPLLPNSVRAVICGPSNCGKTNALFALITHPNGLRFENVYVHSKSLNQPKYQFLKELLESIEDIGYYPFNDREDVVKPEDTQPNSLMIFDDVACEKQDNMRAFFCMGRHREVDCFYLCQTYAHVPKHLVRDNTNFLILFRQDEMNLKHIYDDHVNTDMPYTQFKELCAQC
uniref:ATPase AAA-type core domain-containing protein n=1 Tax=Bracon brevicornis TaxID=1563983 RepID=A0A6V7KP37_9HYME